MNGPIISYQLGKIRRKRLEAEAAAYRHAKTNETGKPGLSTGGKLAIALGGAMSAIILIAQIAAA